MKQTNPPILYSAAVRQALEVGQPVVALESTVITHGLPYPQNLKLAQDMEAEVSAEGAVPATIAVLEGQIHAGLEAAELKSLATGTGMVKVSTRDFAPALLHKRSGGTTVAGTLRVAHAAGIRVFATGGIGGVHQGAPFDISTDLPTLAKTPLVVVCAGAKAILDLPATLEQLETLGVPVVGFQTDEFPAFYSVSSGLPVSARVDSPQEAAELASLHWAMGMQSAVLLVQPPPAEAAMEAEQVNAAIAQALAECEREGIRGQGVSPFLLRRVSELTHGESLEANLALLRNNARLAARVARGLHNYKKST
jgi:pseudouridine-5'-phosphate glycosidase